MLILMLGLWLGSYSSLMLSKNELKYIKSLKIKKYRVREKCFLVEGAKNVQELMNSPFEIALVVSTKSYVRNNPVFGSLRNEIISEAELSKLGNFVSNKDCIAVVRTRQYTLSEIDFNNTVFVLDGVSDPGNLGTIIRTLDWFGFNQLICSPDVAEFYNPKVIASTMGSFTRVKIHYGDLVPILKEARLPVYGAEMKGKSLFNTVFKAPSIILMGSESQGISEPVKKLLTASVTIPKHGLAESLNVGVATAIIASYLRMP